LSLREYTGAFYRRKVGGKWEINERETGEKQERNRSDAVEKMPSLFCYRA
jgi:hypothetical protein